jgi:hypothetical protein
MLHCVLVSQMMWRMLECAANVFFFLLCFFLFSRVTVLAEACLLWLLFCIDGYPCTSDWQKRPEMGEVVVFMFSHPSRFYRDGEASPCC